MVIAQLYRHTKIHWGSNNGIAIIRSRLSFTHMKSLAASLFFLMAMFARGSYTADGVGYLPVIVLVTLEDAWTEGVEVRLVDAGETPGEKNYSLGPMHLAIIQNNLAKPVKTDMNSTAVVWMKYGFAETNGTSRSSGLRGRLIIGPEKHPYFSKPLAEIMENPEQAKTSHGPILVKVKKKKKAIQEANKLEDQDQNAQPAPDKGADAGKPAAPAKPSKDRPRNQ